MSLIDSYDESEEVVKAELLTRGQKDSQRLQLFALKKS